MNYQAPQGTLLRLKILHYADFVLCTFSLVQLASKFSFLVHEKRGKGVYVLLLDFVPSAFVFDCICNIFLNRGTDSGVTTFSF